MPNQSMRIPRHAAVVSGGRRHLKQAARIALCAVAVSAIPQITSANSTLYDRTAAVAYADAYANKVVGDGYFWVDSGTCVQYGAGVAAPSGAGLAGGAGDDCAHFVSCAIGSEPHGKGGGLPVPSPLYPSYLQYGNPSAGGIVSWLLNGWGVQATTVSTLTPGDVIGYDWNGNGTIDHVVFYRGGGNIDAHATSHLNVPWNWWGSAYPNIKVTFVHLTEPSAPPATPANNSPANNALMTSLTPRLTGNAFTSSAVGSTHAAAQWTIYKNSSMIYDSGADATDLTSFTVPSGKLSSGNAYAWQVRYEDNYGDWSSYSPLTTFLTTAVPEPGCGVLVVASLLAGRRRRRASFAPTGRLDVAAGATRGIKTPLPSPRPGDGL